MNFFLRFAILLTLVGAMTSCQRKKPAIIQAMEDAQSWTVEFERQYPDPIPPFIERPHFGQTGNIGITRNLQFMLRDFPGERLSELETFVTEKLKSQGLESVTILASVPLEVRRSGNVVELVTLKYYADGRVEDSRITGDLAEIPEPNINGRPMLPSEKTSGDSHD